jgi:Protein of unknown function (DUF4058)
MPSPFPGMNPFLELRDQWPGFHLHYISELARQLGPRIAPEYYTQVEHHVFLHEVDDERLQALRRPDITVFESDRKAEHIGGTAVAISAPVEVRIPSTVDVVKVPYLLIRNRASRKVVTAIELLSPTNKARGSDREVYLGKRKELLASMAHFVEIDLLRGGPKMPWVGLPVCDYSVAVSRSHLRPQVDFWPIELRETLPTIPIPLKEFDREVLLDLQAALHGVYDLMSYEFHLYTYGDPEPPLNPTDLAWVQGIVASSEV